MRRAAKKIKKEAKMGIERAQQLQGGGRKTNVTNRGNELKKKSSNVFRKLNKISGDAKKKKGKRKGPLTWGPMDEVVRDDAFVGESSQKVLGKRGW